ncbi:MAG: hypothetical protein IPJ85_06565 [Flavobacteriales bacterium]|nr:hypothetical protein [Flavobacteriales bacterium]
MEQQPNEPTGQDSQAEEIAESKRSYAGEGENLDFDPMKDLNLPANYDEVVSRFQRLQGTRAMESLN